MNKLSVAVSGGGIRATVFHLGMFKWMAVRGLLDKIERISSVSGGSICIGLILALNDNVWPTGQDYLQKVLPRTEVLIQERGIQGRALLKLLNPFYHQNADRVKDVLIKDWGIDGQLKNLPERPVWYINCTTYETGKRFRFTGNNMGDYKVGYSDVGDVEIAKAVSASAGFPFLIGPTDLNCGLYEWKPYGDYPLSKYAKNGEIIHLWDGGIYDNLGIGSVANLSDGLVLKDDADFLIVSDASLSIGRGERDRFKLKAPRRLLDIAMSRESALRSSQLVDVFCHHKNGIYVKLGNSPQKLIDSLVDKEYSGLKPIINQSEEEAKIAYTYPTDLKKLNQQKYSALINHGYSVAENTYRIHLGNG